MRTRFIMTVLALALPISAQADAFFGNDMARDRKLPRTWGIGIDYFSMDQPYQIDSLSFFPPVLPITDPGLLDVNNEIDHIDLKIDVWVLPFLNLFGIYGQIDGDTTIDLSSLGLHCRRTCKPCALATTVMSTVVERCWRLVEINGSAR